MDRNDHTVLYNTLQMIRAEFHSKISFDFNKLVFLGLRKETRDLDEVVKMAAGQEGYEGHQTVRYGKERVSHFYMKFRNSTCAGKAIVYFRRTDKMFNVDLVNNILLTLYMIERAFDCSEHWTAAYVEPAVFEDHAAYVGLQSETNFLNHLSVDNIRSILHQFGYPRIIPPLQTSPSSVQVLYASMAEALGATIALGEWHYYRLLEQNPSPYRVRIVCSEKEAKILTISGAASPHEAFEMGYFVPTSEVNCAPHAIPALRTDKESQTDSKPEYIRSRFGREYPRSVHGRGRNHNNRNRFRRSDFSSTLKPESNEISDGLCEEFK